MSKVYEQFQDLIGKTPLFRLKNFERNNNLPAKIIAKLEYFNPAGSVKDRIAWAMIEDAEKSGRLKPDSVIIEPTSGNTGVGLAAVAAARGYRIIIVMPETMSLERRKILQAYGAELVLTPGNTGMKGAIQKAQELSTQFENSFMPGQFTNKVNPECHKKTTAREIWNDLDGQLDIFVAGVGTGGTLSGVGEFLKEKNPSIKIVAVEPDSSPVLSEGKAGPHKIQGIGAGFVPDTLNTKIFDEIVRIKNDEAYDTAKEVARTEGLLVGISSGASAFAAKKIAEKNPGKTIVALLPDTGERYLSTLNFD